MTDKQLTKALANRNEAERKQHDRSCLEEMHDKLNDILSEQDAAGTIRAFRNIIADYVNPYTQSEALADVCRQMATIAQAALRVQIDVVQKELDALDAAFKKI